MGRSNDTSLGHLKFVISKIIENLYGQVLTVLIASDSKKSELCYVSSTKTLLDYAGEKHFGLLSKFFRRKNTITAYSGRFKRSY